MSPTRLGLNVFRLSPMGSNFADFDNDGYLDFYLGTGKPELPHDRSPIGCSRTSRASALRRCHPSSGTGHLQKGHGVACGDWDRDGNVDLFQELGGRRRNNRFRSVLFENLGHNNHWLTLKLQGQKTNRPGLAVRIKITLLNSSPLTIHRHVTTGSSFGDRARLSKPSGVGQAADIERVDDLPADKKPTHPRLFRKVPV